MGLFGFGKKGLSAQEKYAKYNNHALWGGSFLTFNELYHCFADVNFDNNDIVTFTHNNSERVMPAEFGGEAPLSCYFEESPSVFPSFVITQSATRSFYFGELMDILQQKGDEVGWKDQPYRIMFLYKPDGWNENQSVPFYPEIEAGDKPGKFIIYGNRWNNMGSGGHQGDGWGGYVAL